MTAPTQPCPGVTAPNSTRPLLRCASGCQRFQWGAKGMEPRMVQRPDGAWECPDEVPSGEAR